MAPPSRTPFLNNSLAPLSATDCSVAPVGSHGFLSDFLAPLVPPPPSQIQNNWRIRRSPRSNRKLQGPFPLVDFPAGEGDEWRRIRNPPDPFLLFRSFPSKVANQFRTAVCFDVFARGREYFFAKILQRETDSLGASFLHPPLSDCGYFFGFRSASGIQ
jgi:hypothetical protein